MSRTPAAHLANLKVRRQDWRVQATESGYEARRGDEVIRAVSMAELEVLMDERD